MDIANKPNLKHPSANENTLDIEKTIKGGTVIQPKTSELTLIVPEFQDFRLHDME